MKMDDSQIMVDIFGSCVTRAIFLDGKLEEKGCVDPRIKINYFFDKHPILSCVTPVPNTEVLNQNTIECIEKEELWQKTEHNLRGIKQELLKSTMPMIKESVAKYFIFDLYDFHTNLMVYDNTMFSPYELYYSFESIFDKFLILFENENIMWIDYLKQAEKLQPRNREVINYLLCYAEAIEDDALILEYQHKLNVVEY